MKYYSVLCTVLILEEFQRQNNMSKFWQNYFLWRCVSCCMPSLSYIYFSKSYYYLKKAGIYLPSLQYHLYLLMVFCGSHSLFWINTIQNHRWKLTYSCVNSWFYPKPLALVTSSHRPTMAGIESSTPCNHEEEQVEVKDRYMIGGKVSQISDSGLQFRIQRQRLVRTRFCWSRLR